MQLPDLLPLFARHPQVRRLQKTLDASATEAEGKATTAVCRLEGLHGSAAAVVLAALTQPAASSSARKSAGETPVQSSDKGRLFLAILPDEEEAGYFYHDLTQLLGESRVLFFPSSYRRAVKYGQKDAAREVLRTQTLTFLQHYEAGTADDKASTAKDVFLVSYPEALAEKVSPRKDLSDRTIFIRGGEEYDLPQLEQQLLAIGFHRRDYVYEPGEFAVRGSILDIYSLSAEYPCRIDFFGDEVETIRTFDVQTQLSQEKLKEVSIVPEMDASQAELVPITDYLPQDAVLVCKSFSYICEVIDKIFAEGFSRQAIAADTEGESLRSEAEQAERDKTRLLAKGQQIQQVLTRLPRLLLAAGGSTEQAEGKQKKTGRKEVRFVFSTAPQPIYHKNFDMLRESFEDFRSQGYRIYITADSEKQLERLRSILRDTESDENDAPPFIPVSKTLHAGFSDASLPACFFTDHQIFDRFHKYNLKSDRARNAKMALTLKELMQFQPGDFIVHIDHGIGRFAGLVRVPNADGTQQEMIKLIFQRDDVVLVSIHSLHKLSKYKGKEGEPPKLSRLGSGAWEKMKDRTKTKLKDIARDLIRLYAERRKQKGFAFSADTFIQHELEAGFKYEDTPDQLRVTQEVKADMESVRPMDRLVCGDVGFGKTEIAVRAALKASVDNKQVAVLVPTTVLALQHYKTFCERLKNFPVRVEYLTRARTAKATKELLSDLEKGDVNIVVGTHKLASSAVKFKDLGLLIIDEEQKFGVSVKEKLRQLKTNVDTLTMSATPIPRTLQFSIMGARDFSVIQTPPPNRRPIQTEVHPFGHEIIAEAINFELSRNGQVFIVTNRISALPNLRELVNKYVPDARVATGHGQMPPTELEKTVEDFINHDYDVLISTTIVENGIDIPNANTIIIDAAHRFGLSDLHQMRGRVGRSDRKAFCYLLAPPLSLLPDDARRRLQAIEEFSDLGAGIHLAMQDLDIRGAGNLLGAEQSGFIADLGYETYIKILNEAIREIREESPAFEEEPADEHRPANAALWADLIGMPDVDCDLHAFLPETYVPGASERMMLYRELDGLQTDEKLLRFRQRLEDRFGQLPPAAEELLRITPLRRYGAKCGCQKISLKQGRMTLYFIADTESAFYRSSTFDSILQYATTNYRACKLTETGGRRRMIVKPVKSVGEAIHILQTITGEEKDAGQPEK